MKILVASVLALFLVGCADLKPYYASVDAANTARANMFIAEAKAKEAQAKAQEALANALVETAKSDKASEAVRVEAVRQAGTAYLVSSFASNANGGSKASVDPVRVPDPPQSDAKQIGLEIFRILVGGGLRVWERKTDKEVADRQFDRDIRLREAEYSALVGVMNNASGVATAALQRPSSVVTTTQSAGQNLVTGGSANSGTSVTGNSNRFNSPDDIDNSNRSTTSTTP